jgi:phage-related protein
MKPLHWVGSSLDDLRAFPGVEDYVGGTYRAVYTTRFRSAVYVLHAFQKKSKKGIATPQREIQMVERRLKVAARHHEVTYE